MKPSEFTCSDVQPHLPLLAGGMAGDDLEPDLVASVRVHTANCTDCAGELRRIETALDALRTVRDERLVEVELWSGVRAELIGSGVLRSAPSAAPAPLGATGVASALTARRGKSWSSKAWSSNVRMRRWSAAAALALAFGAAAFVVTDGRSGGVLPSSGAPAGDSTPAVAVHTPPRIASTDRAPTAPVELAADNGGLHRATLEEQRAWRPAQAFSLQAMDGTSSGGAFVAGDRHLR